MYDGSDSEDMAGFGCVCAVRVGQVFWVYKATYNESCNRYVCLVPIYTIAIAMRA